MGVAGVSLSGIRDPQLNINGLALTMPGMLYPRPTLKQTVSQPLSGRGRVDSWYEGDGLPDVADMWSFELRWDLGPDQATEIAQIETLRVSVPPHTLTYWKKVYARYTALSGQQVFYLPRPDAFSKGYTGHATQSNGLVAQDGATVSVNGVAIVQANTHYVTPVTSATAVTAGHVSISNTPVFHPTSGSTVALFKFGTALVAGDIVLVEYTPLFNVGLGTFETEAFTGEKPGDESKRIQLVELN